MAELATLARPYANAIFKIGKQDRTLEAWSRTLAFLAAAANEDNVRRVLESPTVTDEQKAHTLAEVCREELSDKGRAMVAVLARNRRLPLLAEITEQFEALRAEEERTLDVEVIAAFELGAEQREELVQSLKRRFERDIELTSRVDPDLVGGAVIRAGDTVIDGSVRGRLNKLAEALQRV